MRRLRLKLGLGTFRYLLECNMHVVKMSFVGHTIGDACHLRETCHLSHSNDVIVRAKCDPMSYVFTKVRISVMT